MSPHDAWPEQFDTLLKDLACVLGEGAADFLENPICFRNDRRPHLVFGPAKQDDAFVEACLVKDTVFASLFDPAQPLWFVFTEEMFKGETGPHGPYPSEAPSIWDQPGLLPSELKSRSELRTFEKVDPYLLQGPAYRQWILFVRADEIGIEKLHQACARWGRQTSGLRLRARLCCLQPGVPAVALNNELEGAMVLLAKHSGGLRPYAQLFRQWLKKGSPGLMDLPGMQGFQAKGQRR